MEILLSIVLVLIVAVLGWLVLPLLSMFITVPVMLALRWISPLLSYMVARYMAFAFDIAVLVWLIAWAGDRFTLTTWPGWLVAGWCMFTAGNTLILFDTRCYLSDSGAWAPRMPIENR